MTDYEDLLAAVASGRAAFVLGTGSTILATQNRDLTWAKLLSGGLSWLADKNFLREAVKDRLVAQLEFAVAEDEIADLLSVAERLSSELRRPGPITMANWLRDNFGSLSVRDKRVAVALQKFGRPILTTNYDTTLEAILGYQSVTWREPNLLQQVMTGEMTEAVGHLHGVWTDGDSVVLGVGDYTNLLSSTPAQELQHALHSMNSLIFIGFGAGLDDPNFHALTEWWKLKLGTTAHRHYQLCRDEDVATLEVAHATDNVRVVSYGKQFSDLPRFLETMASTLFPGKKVARDAPLIPPGVAAARGRSVILERVREEHIFVEKLDDDDSRSSSDLLIPPVLLPMPQEQFAAAQKTEDDLRPRRYDSHQEASLPGVVLLAAGEQVGLTSALEWMLDQNVQNDDTTTPLLVDYRRLQKTRRPLEGAIRRQASQAMLIAGKTDPLPRLALAIDNLSETPSDRFETVVQELQQLQTSLVVLGCREGEEASIHASLSAAGVECRLRYLGRLNRRDIRALASLAAPTKSVKLADRAVDVLNREHLPRTPFYVGLLLTLLLEKEAYMSTSSETALLDAYVNLLMGRGDPQDDARFTLDALERSDILSSIAEIYVKRRVGSISQADFIEALGAYFKAVGWKETPYLVFKNFHDRRLLTLRGDQVSFTQSSYLHLFAAKRAVHDEDFRAMLMAEPLYFSPIIRHYAALTRNDRSLLELVGSVLDQADAFSSSPTRLFARTTTEVESPEDTPSLIDEVFDRIEARSSAIESNAVVGSEVRREEVDWLDTMVDEDEAPFPLLDLDSAPALIKLTTIVVLVSTVLRDSELVRDIDLKRSLLRRICALFGRAADALDSSPEFEKALDEAASLRYSGKKMTEGRRRAWQETFRDAAPVLSSFGLMSLNLSSRKLLVVLEELMADETFLASPHEAVMGALLGYDVQAPQWPQWFFKVRQLHGSTLAAREGLMRVAQVAFQRHKLSGADREILLDAISENWASGFAFPNDRARKSSIGRYRQRLDQHHALSTAGQLKAGDTVLSEVMSD